MMNLVLFLSVFFISPLAILAALVLIYHALKRLHETRFGGVAILILAFVVLPASALIGLKASARTQEDHLDRVMSLTDFHAETRLSPEDLALRRSQMSERLATRFREENGAFLFTVVSAGTECAECVQRNSPARNGYFGGLLGAFCKSDFKPTTSTKYEVAILKGSLFSEGDRTVGNVLAEAERRGWSKPNPEVACLIQKGLRGRETDRMGFSRVIVMHEPLTSKSYLFSLRSLERDAFGYGLSVVGFHGDSVLARDVGFVFVVKTESLVGREEPRATVRFRSWSEVDNVVYLNVGSDSADASDWMKRFDNKGITLDFGVKDLLRSPDFKPASSKVYRLAILKGSLFKDAERTEPNILAEAKNRGLEIPTPEVACLLRKWLWDIEVKDMGLAEINVMHRPIKAHDYGGYPWRLGVNTEYTRGAQLTWYSSDPRRKWSADAGFVFIDSKAVSEYTRL